MDIENNQLGIRVTTTKTPKPNAQEYTIRTIEELFNVVTVDNIDKFLSDIDAGIRVAVQMREAVKSIAELSGATISNKDIGMDRLVWIDD